MAIDLITGFPGFIGRRLVARLLDEEGAKPVVALVEARMEGPAREAATALDPERVEVLVGDVSQRRLGLSDPDWDRLRSQVRRVFHLAAIYDLAVPVELAQRVNVDGTGNVLELCAEAAALERLAYVSTAYVAGKRTGVVYEHELVMGQQFKNHYESTKFQAEVWVRQEMRRVPTTILRPAIVVGDSQTGETQKFDGPYYILRAISETRRAGRPMVQPGRSDARFNVVPVDYVVEAIATAAALAGAEGETLHLVDPEPLTSGDLTRMLAEHYGARPPRGRVPPAVIEAALRIPAVKSRFGDTPKESIAYLNHPVEFDTRRTVDLLGARGLTPPNFTDYAEAIVRYFKAHEHD
jgi:thioester reductase-like protein